MRGRSTATGVWRRRNEIPLLMCFLMSWELGAWAHRGVEHRGRHNVYLLAIRIIIIILVRLDFHFYNDCKPTAFAEHALLNL